MAKTWSTATGYQQFSKIIFEGKPWVFHIFLYVKTPGVYGHPKDPMDPILLHLQLMFSQLLFSLLGLLMPQVLMALGCWARIERTTMETIGCEDILGICMCIYNVYIYMHIMRNWNGLGSG